MDKSRKEEESTNKGNKGEQSSTPIEDIFKGFASQDKESGGKTIDLEGAKKWFKQANISDVTDDDIKAAFSKLAGSNKGVDVDKFKDMVNQIAKDKKLEAKDLMDKITSVNSPGGSGKGLMDSIKDLMPGKGSEKEDETGAKGYQTGLGPSAGQDEDEDDSKDKDALHDLTKSPKDDPDIK